MSAEDAVKEEESKRRRRRRKQEANEAEEAQEGGESRGITEGKGRATPGRRNRASRATTEKSSGNALTRPFRGITEYFRGVSDEMSKVVWPDREDLIRLTRIVLLVTIASALVLGGIAFIFTELFILGFENELVFVGFFVLVAGFAIAVNRYMARQDDMKRY